MSRQCRNLSAVLLGISINEALSARLTAAVAHEHRRTLALAVALNKPFRLEGLGISLPVPRHKETLRAHLGALGYGAARVVGVIEVAPAGFLDYARGDVGAENRKTVVRKGVELIYHALVDLGAPVGLLLCVVLFGDVAYEHVEHIAVSGQVGEMPVIIDPAHRTVAAYDTVLHVIEVIVRALAYLRLYRSLYPLVIVGVYQTLEGKARQRPELLLGLAAEYAQAHTVPVYELLLLVLLVNKESSGHLLCHPHYRGLEHFFVQFKEIAVIVHI